MGRYVPGGKTEVLQVTGERRWFASMSVSLLAAPFLSGCSEVNESESPLKLGEPLSIGPVGEFAFPCSSEEAEWYRRQMVPGSKKLNQGQCLHMLYLHGVDARFEGCRIGGGKELLKLILDAKAGGQEFGQACFVRTRFGLRVPENARLSRSDEAHRDQTLAMLAHLGVSSVAEVHLADEVSTVGEAIRDSVATFDLTTTELEWSAWAYALYLQQPNWRNRFGVNFSFDQMVDSLRSRSMHSASCGGTHVLLSLTMILRANEQRRILTDRKRDELKEFLERAVIEAVRQQQPDGSWKIDWHRELILNTEGGSLPDTPRERLIATGHIAEWLLYVPENLQPPEEIYRMSAVWLTSELRRVEEKQAELFCPFTHGLFVVIRGSSSKLRLES